MRIRPDDFVESIDQLMDERGRLIATETGLNMGAVYPLCVQINFEVNSQNKHLLKGIPEEGRNEALKQYKLMMAAASVLSYELSQRPSVTFPEPCSDQVKNVPQDILKNLKKVGWQTRRMAVPSYYDMMGRIFEHNYRNLEATLASGKIEVDIDATYAKLFQSN